jgi:hypothetical protein
MRQNWELIVMAFIQKCFSLFIVLCLTGCISYEQIQKMQDEGRVIMTARFYSGPPREQNDVSLLMKGWGSVFPSSLDGLAIKEAFWKGYTYYGYPQILEVLPGRHAINIGYRSSNTTGRTTTTSTGNVALNIDVKPGHVYVYYPEFPTENTWRPVFVDINELSNPRNPESNIRSRLKESVFKYFRGERPLFTGLTQKQ